MWIDGSLFAFVIGVYCGWLLGGGDIDRAFWE